jgi:putative ABC transport system substrate-binding protein
MWFRGVGLSIAFILSLLMALRTAEAQQPTKVYRVGWLNPGAPSITVELVRQGLRELGYREGQNLILEYRSAEGRDDRLADFATELVRLQVDVIVAGGLQGVRAAQHATRTIPIVMLGITDPVAQGFVASLAHPGGNITGMSSLNEGLVSKRHELLKELVPQSARIAVLTNPANPLHASWMHDLTVTAHAVGVQLHVVEVRRADELDSAFVAMTHAGADALLVLSDPVLLSKLYQRTVDLAATHRLPAMYDWRYYVDAGGLMFYRRSVPENARRITVYVDKILQGAKPAELPVEQPAKFELVLNRKTAQVLGITFPPTLLVLADEVLQ